MVLPSVCHLIFEEQSRTRSGNHSTMSSLSLVLRCRSSSSSKYKRTQSVVIHCVSRPCRRQPIENLRSSTRQPQLSSPEVIADTTINSCHCRLVMERKSRGLERIRYPTLFLPPTSVGCFSQIVPETVSEYSTVAIVADRRRRRRAHVGSHYFVCRQWHLDVCLW